MHLQLELGQRYFGEMLKYSHKHIFSLYAIYIHIFMQSIHTYMNTQMHIHKYINKYVYINVHMYIHIYFMYMVIHMCIYLYGYTYVYIYTTFIHVFYIREKIHRKVRWTLTSKILKYIIKSFHYDIGIGMESKWMEQKRLEILVVWKNVMYDKGNLVGKDKSLNWADSMPYAYVRNNTRNLKYKNNLLYKI